MVNVPRKQDIMQTSAATAWTQATVGSTWLRSRRHTFPWTWDDHWDAPDPDIGGDDITWLVGDWLDAA